MKGRDELYTFLSKKVEKIVDLFFLHYLGYTQFDQFLENPEIWKSRTLKQAKNFLRAYIDQPSKTYDFIGTLRKILRTGNNGYISLQAPEGNIYGGNTLLEQGLKIAISYDELVKILSFDNLGDLSTETLFTLLFHHASYGTNTGYMSPTGYSLDFDQFWGMNNEKISVKSVKAYNTIINTFSEENLGNVLYEKKFTIKLLVDRGAGINRKRSIVNRFGKFGLSRSEITFTPNNPISLHNAIASMITYLYAFPDTFYVIKQGYKNFMFGDIFNIHTSEYVSESDYADTVGGTFMWSGDGSTNGLTSENYDNLIAAYSDNFNDRDIRYLLGFDNEDIVGLILDNFQTMFRQKLHEDIFIKDLRLSEFMFGDMPFQLNNYYDTELIKELIQQGIIYPSETEKLVAIARNRGIPDKDNPGSFIEDPRTIWLDMGNEGRGIIHIVRRHSFGDESFDEFWGISDPYAIGNLIFQAITEYPIVGLPQSGRSGREKFYVYAIRRDGVTNYLHILVTDDGSIITAFPSMYENPYRN